MPVIIGLDPGASTGYAFVEPLGEELKVWEYGILDVTEPGTDALVRRVRRFMEEHTDPELIVVFSKVCQFPRRPTHHPSVEAQGVIRAYGGIEYAPATIHSSLGTRNKTDTKVFVSRVLGFKPSSIDHVADAFAVAMCHALKMGWWQARIDLRSDRTRDKSSRNPRSHARNPRSESVTREWTPNEIARGLESGEVRLKKK